MKNLMLTFFLIFSSNLMAAEDNCAGLVTELQQAMARQENALSDVGSFLSRSTSTLWWLDSQLRRASFPSTPGRPPIVYTGSAARLAQNSNLYYSRTTNYRTQLRSFLQSYQLRLRQCLSEL